MKRTFYLQFLLSLLVTELWIGSPFSLPLLMAEDGIPSLSKPEILSYSKPPDLWDTVKHYPLDYADFLANMLSYDAKTYYEVAGATIVLLPFDQRLADGSKDFAIKNRIMNNKAEYRTAARYSLVSTRSNVQFPATFQGVTWYFGDGMFSLEIAGLFGSFGSFSADNRMAHVSTQIIESLLVTGPSVLAIKVMTGRESPLKSTSPGGHWWGYPGILPYTRNQSRYYSFPSGHVATAVTTLTVISKNYMEKSWIAPIGGVMVGLLMFSLMNVGSHWPSDFPLAILIGYSSGTTIVNNDRERDRKIANIQASASESLVGFAWKGLSPHCLDRVCGLQSEWVF